MQTSIMEALPVEDFNTFYLGTFDVVGGRAPHLLTLKSLRLPCFALHA